MIATFITNKGPAKPPQQHASTKHTSKHISTKIFYKIIVTICSQSSRTLTVPVSRFVSEKEVCNPSKTLTPPRKYTQAYEHFLNLMSDNKDSYNDRIRTVMLCFVKSICK